jgi:hypothetical protein
MKSFFFFIALMYASIAFSQGNLQFNQVLTYGGKNSNSNPTITPYGTTTYGSPSYTVPANKVWKIEFMFMDVAGYFVLNTYALNPNITNTMINTPIWLKAGDIIKSGNGGSSGGNYVISIIEFNIVP